jgi:hypothetical protein
MIQLQNVWLDSLTSFDDVLVNIKENLSILKENAADADFFDIGTKRQYSNDVIFMKQFFERAEFLARAENDK